MTVICGYVLMLIVQREMFHLENPCVLTFSVFALLGVTGVARYTYGGYNTQKCYRLLSGVSHGVGLPCLALASLSLHNLVLVPDYTLPLHLSALLVFLSARTLLGAQAEDYMTKIGWSCSVLVVFYSGAKAFHWLEIAGSSILAGSFTMFYFNRLFTDKRTLLGVRDISWYLLLLDISLLLLGHCFFGDLSHIH